MLACIYIYFFLIIIRTPGSSLTNTLFPVTTLVRSAAGTNARSRSGRAVRKVDSRPADQRRRRNRFAANVLYIEVEGFADRGSGIGGRRPALPVRLHVSAGRAGDRARAHHWPFRCKIGRAHV